MNPEMKNDNKQPIGIASWFHRVSANEVFVKSPCVFTENPYHLIIGQVYEIHDLSKEGVNLLYVKLLWAYLKGMTFHIIAVDIQNGELVHMSQRLGVTTIPCSFLIADLLYFDEEGMSTKILRGLTDNDMELLEFDFPDS